MSHPDESGAVPYIDGQPPYIKQMYETVYSGNVPKGMTRGAFDRNFLFDDGSVTLVNKVAAPMLNFNDERLIAVDYWAKGRGRSWGYLPPVGTL